MQRAVRLRHHRFAGPDVEAATADRAKGVGKIKLPQPAVGKHLGRAKTGTVIRILHIRILAKFRIRRAFRPSRVDPLHLPIGIAVEHMPQQFTLRGRGRRMVRVKRDIHELPRRAPVRRATRRTVHIGLDGLQLASAVGIPPLGHRVAIHPKSGRTHLPGVPLVSKFPRTSTRSLHFHFFHPTRPVNHGASIPLGIGKGGQHPQSIKFTRCSRGVQPSHFGFR